MMMRGWKEVEGRVIGRGFGEVRGRVEGEGRTSGSALEGSFGAEGQQVSQHESTVKAESEEEREEVEGEGDDGRLGETAEALSCEPDESERRGIRTGSEGVGMRMG